MHMKLVSTAFPNVAGWISKCAISASHLLLAAGVALGILGTYRYASGYFAMGSHGVSGGVIAALLSALTVAGVAGSIHLARRDAPVAPRIFVPLLLSAGFAIHLLLIILVKPQWGTDYLRYWEYAQALIERGEYSGLNAPYYSRSLFVPYPVIKLFGAEATFALKLVNILLLSGIQVFVYDALRRFASHQAAQSGSLILLAAPLPAYLTLIPSHDLWGTFFLTATAWLIVCAMDLSRKGRHWSVWIGLGAIAGVVAFMTEVQRSMGLIFCAALLLSAIFGWIISIPGGENASSDRRRQSLSALLVSLACLATFFGSTWADRHLKLNSESRPILLNMKFAANGGGMGNGKSDWFARFRDRFIDKQSSADEAKDFARSSALSSWALQPGDRTARLAGHASRLFSTTYPRDWDWVLRKPEGRTERTRQALMFYADTYGLAFGALLLLAILRISALRQPAPILINTLSMFLVALSLSLLLLFENKPYNIFPIWIFGTLAIGYALSLPPQARSGSLTSNSAVGAVGLIVVTALVLVLSIRGFYTVAHGRLLSGWTFDAQQTARAENSDWARELIDARPEAFDAHAYDPETLAPTYINQSAGDGDRIRKYAGDAVTRMQFPAPVSRGDVLSLSAPVCTGADGRTRLEFFAYAPTNYSFSGTAFTLSVSVDGYESESVRIPFEGRNFQRFLVDKAFSAETCHQFAFLLRANESDALNGAELEQFIEIWVPRLVH